MSNASILEEVDEADGGPFITPDDDLCVQISQQVR
jgi:hypothetical protein